MFVAGPPIPIAVLSAGIFHDDYGIYDDDQREVLVAKQLAISSLLSAICSYIQIPDYYSISCYLELTVICLNILALLIYRCWLSTDNEVIWTFIAPVIIIFMVSITLL